ncbi:MAG: phosphoribosylanthranilate isomerase [Elusimicrobia bacterium]|jgi:phosphoribosylanthranilate isomerase|nr:phosphoribosylanthranilate isomerase [Elusimicrobiota bacterium]MBK7207028.1 phosphoribosylanthranilate isomerase [Elusimicrobiota bacterium]MBK7545848.1 phosphoribosylanthranilate isomerase [Elusimicrobiota bacterium]MBK7575112.1 phosphoribosylanthranilate isomerase [Elusimicrobiota bacterium]MBK7687623.1 phosphoribosylanthranilate isomerase [Elusimicrobiota bacterium]
MTKIKICGVTNEEDATWAVNLGAHYIGLNFCKESPRKVSPEQAAKIARKVPSFVPTVGVFVEHTVPEILKIAQKVGLTGVQLHGDQTPEDARALSEKLEVLLIKAFRVGGEADLEQLAAYKDVVGYFLLDARVEGVAGGTGQTFPWDLAVRARAFGKPLFLAGGLTPDNVAQAVEAAQPFAVDVASGVEKSPKRKDFDRMKKFIDEAKNA